MCCSFNLQCKCGLFRCKCSLFSLKPTSLTPVFLSLQEMTIKETQHSRIVATSKISSWKSLFLTVFVVCLTIKWLFTQNISLSIKHSPPVGLKCSYKKFPLKNSSYGQLEFCWKQWIPKLTSFYSLKYHEIHLNFSKSFLSVYHPPEGQAQVRFLAKMMAVCDIHSI